VDIDFGATDDPDVLGAHPGALGLPRCEATVSYPGRGYQSQFGWIQLVRSTDNRSGGSRFDMDPLEILGDVAHPFGYFGIRPTLFDAPSRDARTAMDWTAHSYLTVVGGQARRDVRALCGFSWGFTISAGRVSLDHPTPLPAEEWNDHLSVLTATYPDWRFTDDFWRS
jgi:hypothetical protein